MNVRGYCNENWDNIPIGIRRLRLFVDSFEAVFIMMWLFVDHCYDILMFNTEIV